MTDGIKHHGQFNHEKLTIDELKSCYFQIFKMYFFLTRWSRMERLGMDLTTHRVITYDKWNKQWNGVGRNGLEHNCQHGDVWSCGSENGNTNDPSAPVKPLLATLDLHTDTLTRTNSSFHDTNTETISQWKHTGQTEWGQTDDDKETGHTAADDMPTVGRKHGAHTRQI